MILADLSSLLSGLGVGNGTIFTILACGALYFLAFKYNIPGTKALADSELATLAPRLAKLMQFLPTLGLSVPPLTKIVTDGAQGNFTGAAGDIHDLLNSLDDKTTRGHILDNLFYVQLQRQLEDEGRKATLVAKLKSLGVI